MSLHISNDEIKIVHESYGMPKIVFTGHILLDGSFCWNLGVSEECFKQFLDSTLKKESVDKKYVSIKLTEKDPEYNFMLDSLGNPVNSFIESDSLAYMTALNIFVFKGDSLVEVQFEYFQDIYCFGLIKIKDEIKCYLKLEDLTFKVLSSNNSFKSNLLTPYFKELEYPESETVIIFNSDSDSNACNLVSSFCYRELLSKI